MFIITSVADTIRIPPNMLSIPSLTAVHSQMDQRYPNKVLMDIGLIICRYGDCLKIGDGICVQGEGGAHHECLVKLVIFRPFVDEVCTGRIKKSTPDGIQVSLGFFQDIFIPPYWMLRPSKYEASTGLWVWTPNFEEGEDEEDEEDGEGGDNTAAEGDPDGGGEGAAGAAADGDEGEDESRYEMSIGSEIRFKVKSINFTQVTNTAKGMQATTTTTAQAQAAIHPNQMAAAAASSNNKGPSEQPSESVDATKPQPVRKRSVSVDLTESGNLPATMHVVASICEDGLGLTSWWEAQEEEEEGEEEAE